MSAQPTSERPVRLSREAFAAWRGEETAEGAEAAGAPMWRHFRRGLVTNLLNPKAAVFFIAVQPAFLPPAPEIDRVLVFSAVFVAGGGPGPTGGAGLPGGGGAGGGSPPRGGGMRASWHSQAGCTRLSHPPDGRRRCGG